MQLGTKYNGVPQRQAGWSESWYATYGFNDRLVELFKRVMQKRALMLPASAAIVGSRYQEINGDTVGASTSRNIYYSGVTGSENDMPQIALKYLVGATGQTNKKILILRGIPDSQVVNGEFSPSNTFRIATAAFLTEIGTGWCFRAVK